MTLLAESAPQLHDEIALRPVPWRRMVWVTWRQHRATLISVPAVLGAIAVFLLVAGVKIHHNYGALRACHPLSSSVCGGLNTLFNRTDWQLGNAVNIFLNLAPAVIGVFAGAPLLARELETGTYRYAWTQGFGRERWTIAKLVLIAVPLAGAIGAFAVEFAWFFQPFLKQEKLTVMSTAVFDTRPIAYGAWTLAAIAIGGFAGVLVRRIVPAMAVTLAAYFGLALATWLLLQTNSTQVSRFWPLQFAEGGGLLVFTGALMAATVWLVRRRAA